jgi:hypothetical protein
MKTIKDLKIGDKVFLIHKNTLDIKSIEVNSVSELKKGYVRLSNGRYSNERRKEEDEELISNDMQTYFNDQYNYLVYIDKSEAIKVIIANIKKAMRAHLANMSKQISILTDYELAYTNAMEELNILDKTKEIPF